VHQYNFGYIDEKATVTLLKDLYNTIKGEVPAVVYILFPDGIRRKFIVQEWYDKEDFKKYCYYGGLCGCTDRCLDKK
jgi:hypothetical protein